ncbi:zinc finger protein ush isoform X3 [Hermetia illucens]|uniref:zinc finger protein ush isoform X3 n=1 Tax=Hermetia illucens TaxID=343691 RepID=UPI0018CC4102|nr:zinc finger protein ush isoform X3 [Hermetia illucens]
MSRRKQSNPKPLLKSDCQDPVEEIATERDSSETDDSREDTTNSDALDVHMEEKLGEPSFSSTSPPSNAERSDEKATRNQSPPSEQVKEPQEPKLPKVRLNASLASDPALKPDAKDLKIINNESLIDELTKHDSKSEGVKSPNGVDMLQRVKVFMCHPCGIGFSSLSTLEAHQTYYCSHSFRKDNEEDTHMANIIVPESVASGEPSAKSVKTGKQYACAQCSYSADKKVSLNRHMRMHQTSPVSTSNMSNGDDNSSQQTDRYCSECDIRFSNVKTYRAHKQHYCHSRRMDNLPATTDATQKPESTSPPARATTPLSSLQPFLALPTNPILIIPYSLLRMASFLPGPMASLTGGVENSDSTCFTYENGTMRPLAVAISNPNTALSTASSEPSNLAESAIVSNNGPSPSVLTEKNLKAINPAIFKACTEDSINRESAPLDLSFRKSPFERPADGKENLSDKSDKMTPEHIVCAPSLPSSPSLTPSPSKKQTLSPSSLNLPPSPNTVVSGKTSPRTISADVAIKIAESSKNIELALKLTSALGNKSEDGSHTMNSALINLPTNLPLNIVPNVTNLSPQIYVKQGVSKCKECNIVFCKYENYLAHKQHYCSARNKDDIEGKNHSTSNIVSQSDTVPPPVAYQQLICAACGIKYTSLDNLRAHQSYYCPKGSDLSVQVATGKDKCTKCKVIHENGQCTFTQGSYKCPVCDVVSLSAIESRKHLETHGSVKAFRCSICRYKGNTLRGMRTHIRMHFDKKAPDFNEENYMSCIMEEDGMEIISTETMRHMKLVHSQPSMAIASPISTEKKESYSQNGDSASTNLTEESPVYGVKIEAVDPKPNSVLHVSDEIPNIKSEVEETTSSSGSKEINSSVVVSSTPPLLSDDCPLKYCQTCDIKFKYMNSYLAHKQFYCKRTRNENDDLNSESNQPSCAVNKNKENIETVL